MILVRELLIADEKHEFLLWNLWLDESICTGTWCCKR